MEYSAYRNIIDHALAAYDGRVFCLYRYASGVVGERTYKDVRTIAEEAEAFLTAHGMERGDRALILCTDHYRALVTFLALTRAGVTAVLPDPYLPPGTAERTDPVRRPAGDLCRPDGTFRRFGGYTPYIPGL